MKTVYLYMSHMGSMAHTLFAVPIDPCKFNNNNNNNCAINKNNPSDPTDQKIEPIIEFPSSEYPEQMACAKLGSKLYFMGGERFPGDPDPNHTYPPDVYVFDEDMYQCEGKAVIQKLEVGMTTGKPTPVAFTADGKLFILGSCGGPNLISFMSAWPTHFAASSFRFFEVYDPTTKEWTLLDDPPVTTPTIWVSSPFVVGRKVYLYGRLVGRGSSGVLLCFHLDSYEWVDPAKDVQRLHHRPGRMLIGDTYYGLAPGGSGVVRQGSTQEEDDEQLLFCLRRGMDFHSFSSHMFCYLWDRHFCEVVTGSLPHPLLPLHFGMLDQHRRYFSIRVFREIPAEEEGPKSLPSKLMYSADYLFQSTYSSFGTLLGCYPFDTNRLSVGCPGVATYYFTNFPIRFTAVATLRSGVQDACNVTRANHYVRD